MSRSFRALVCGVALLWFAAPAAADSGDVAFDDGLQWGLERIGIEQAWETSRGDGITIAVIDSGVALDHEDLEGKLVTGTACRGTAGDPAACSGSPADDDGHGTHVAGVAAAATGNGTGIAGVAPAARVMPLKILFTDCPNCQSAGSADDVVAATRWAAERGADVINLSLGSSTSDVFGPGFAEALEFAWSRGSIPVVAAGNDYVRTADLGDAPALVVSATSRDDTAPSYSNGIGTARWAVAAPGGAGADTPESCAQDGSPRGILSTYWAPDAPRRAYACLSGTSMAAPHVSGVLALLLARGHTPESAVARVMETAVDLGEPGFDALFGAGRLDAAAALAGPPPTAAPTDPALPATPPDVAPASPSTGTPDDPSDDAAERAEPQLFVDDPADGVPGALAALAVAAIVAVLAGQLALHRRTSAT